MAKKLILIRDVTPEECHWLDKTYPEGMIVYEFNGHTYGCVSPGGVACSEENNEGPFFQLPETAVIYEENLKMESPIPEQKPVYRIWDKVMKKYVSGSYSGKKQWISLHWAIENAKNHFPDSLKKGDIEIHTLAFIVKEKMNPSEIIQKKENERVAQETLRKEKYERRKVAESFLQGLLPGEPVHNIIKLYGRGAFNEKLMAEMKDGIEKFKENN